MSKIDEFESMIVVNLREGLDSGSTLVVDDELIYQQYHFGNMVDGIVTFEDTSGSINLVGDVETFLTIDVFGSTMIDTPLAVKEN